jgi:serine phosphatase RsbU (regulator of sigma subunit)
MELNRSQLQKMPFSDQITFVVVMALFYSLVYIGMVQFEQRNKEFELQHFSDRASNILGHLKANTDPEKFWASTLFEDFEKSKDAEEFIKKIVQHRQTTGERLSCVVWNERGELFFNDHFKNDLAQAETLDQLYLDLKIVQLEGKIFSKEILTRLRSVLGPQLPMHKISSNNYYKHLQFIRPDSAGIHSDFWVNLGARFSALVFFDRNTIVEDAGLLKLIDKLHEPDMTVKYKSANYTGNQTKDYLLKIVNRMQQTGKFAEIISGKMVAGKITSGNKLLVVYKDYQAAINPGKASLFLFLTGCFLLLLSARSFNRAFTINSYSVKWQLLLMLFITTGLPLLSLATLASDHISRKKVVLTRNAYQKCIAFLQNVDQRSRIIYAKIHNETNKSIEELKRILPRSFGTLRASKMIKKHFKKALQDIRLVSSAPAELMSEYGVFRNNRFHKFKTGKNFEKEIVLEMKMFCSIAAYFMAVLNEQPVAQEEFTETELFAEMVYQRPFHEILQNLLIANNQIIPLGWGEKPYPALVKMISLKNDKVTDYFFTLLFEKSNLQSNFLYGNSQNLERNDEGLKFTFANNHVFSKESIPIESDPWFNGIFLATGKHPSLEPCFTKIHGKPHVYAGIKAQNLDMHYLFAFYPLEKIDEQIAEERKFLLSAAIIALIMLSGLAIVFSSSFVLPLSALQTGALAIQKRDFSFRLEECSQDEFGRMAKIFNHSIANFEELSLARIVQTRLFPQKGIFENSIEIFGKSIPMAELGGDYFDFFNSTDNHLVVLAGDVAGHGVGASLIMAMAKAGIICNSSQQDNPAAILQQLHRIIHETRSKEQRKVMTFQYLYLNKTTGEAVYSNAGACSPILVDGIKKTANEVTLPGPVLGGFKNSKFNNLEFTLKPGQAIVFYTDGIIEALNPAGKEIGYEGFKRILIECFDLNSQQFYEKVLKRYHDWLDTNLPQDDLTLIMLVKK